MARVELDGLELSIGAMPILKGVSLNVADGECLALLGPSGCGKTTTLRAIAGFLRADRGEIRFDGVSVDRLAAHRRNVGLVFQDYALFPHMSIDENIGFGLKMRGLTKTQIAGKVSDALAMVKLQGLGGRFPSEMSGGQRQRVALARAIVIEPDVLLLDEPLGALDRKLRDEMQVELKRLQRKLRLTTIIVTHDQEEALSLADRIAVMLDGRIAETAAPLDLYQRPRAAEIMAFLGRANFFMAHRQPDDDDGIGRWTTAFGAVLSVAAPVSCNILRIGIRPEHLLLKPGKADPARGECDAVITDIIYRGSSAEILLRAADASTLAAELPATDLAMKAGDPVAFALPARHLVSFGEPNL